MGKPVGTPYTIRGNVTAQNGAAIVTRYTGQTASKVWFTFPKDPGRSVESATPRESDGYFSWTSNFSSPPEVKVTASASGYVSQSQSVDFATRPSPAVIPQFLLQEEGGISPKSFDFSGASASFVPWKWQKGASAHAARLIAASGTQLYKIEGDDQLSVRIASDDEVPWLSLGTTPARFEAITATDKRLFAVSKENELWTHRLPFRNVGTSGITPAAARRVKDMVHDLVAFMESPGVFEENQLGLRESAIELDAATQIPVLLGTTEDWFRIGEVRLADTTAIFSESVGRLRGLFGQDWLGDTLANATAKMLLPQEAIYSLIGSDEIPVASMPSTDILALAATSTQLFALTSHGRLLARPQDLADIPFLDVGSAGGLSTLTAVRNRLFAARLDGTLWSRAGFVGDAGWNSFFVSDVIDHITLAGAVTGDGAGRLYAVDKKSQTMWAFLVPVLLE